MEMLQQSGIFYQPGLGAVLLLLVAIIIICFQAIKRPAAAESQDNAAADGSVLSARTANNDPIIAAITAAVNEYQKSTASPLKAGYAARN